MALDVLAIVALGWYSVVWAVCLLGWQIARTRYTQPVPPLPVLDEDLAEGVTILRPLCGLDDNLYENLESSFLQDYPKYELVFCVAEERDQAIPIVRALLERYKHVDARLIIGESDVGANPKINNLAKGYREAKYDVVWILDSNVLTTTQTLARSVSALQLPGAGLIHHVPLALYPGSDLGGRLDQAFLNTTHAKMYIAINRTGIDSCIMGKSNMFRRSDLERSIPLYKPLHRVGDGHKSGLEAFGCFLGEDNLIGLTLMHGGKLKHVMTADVAGNTVGGMSLRTYFWRRVRWIRARKYMTTMLATLVEPLTESLLVGALASWAVHRLFDIPAWLFFIAHETTWYFVDTSVFASLTAASPAVPPPRAAHEQPGGIAFLYPWALRELLALPIWLTAMAGNRIDWRGPDKKYTVHWNGTVTVEKVQTRETLLSR